MKKPISLVLLISILFLSACSNDSPPSLSVGSNLWPGYETLHLANELGFYDGYPISLVELSSATDVINAFKFGRLDVAALTLDEAILVKESISDLVVFLVMDISNGADKLIARSSINTLKDLLGKRVGVEQTAVGAFFFSLVLEKAGLSRDQVTVISTTIDQHQLMMESGILDAVVTFEPVASTLISQGHNSLIDSSHFPDKIVDALVTRKSVLKEKEQTINHLVSTHWKALDYLASNPDKAAEIISPRLRLTSSQLLDSLDGMILPDKAHNLRLLNDELPTTAQLLNEMMIKQGVIDTKQNVNDLITDTVVK